MRRWIRPLLVLVLVGFVPLPAWSIIIETKDGKIYRGHLVEQNPLRVTIRLDGKKQQMTFKKDEIARSSRAVDESRLRALKPENLQEYWDYAQELTAQREDPEARDTALRLYLICAYHDPTKHAYQSLQAMTKLARSDTEERAFRAMAYQVDLLRDKDTLKKSGAMLSNPESRGNFIQALQYLRRGKVDDAKKYVTKPGVAEYFDQFPGLMTHQEFLAMCAKYPECRKCVGGRIVCVRCGGNAAKKKNCIACNTKGWNICETCDGSPRRVPLAAGQVDLILRLQTLHAKNPQGQFNEESFTVNDWSRLLAPQQLRPVPVLSLQHLTEFDPRQTVFRNGKWIQPNGK